MEGKLKLTPCVGCVGKLAGGDLQANWKVSGGSVEHPELSWVRLGADVYGSLARNHFVWREFQFV